MHNWAYKDKTDKHQYVTDIVYTAMNLQKEIPFLKVYK